MIEFGLLGEKLGHSYSPQIHRVFGDYDYQLYPVGEEELKRILTEKQFRGLNVTIPYKQAVLPFCDEISDSVRLIGSANTLVNRHGKIRADNTDLPGFLTMIEMAGISLTGKKVIILGSGGTSLTAQAACKQQNARETVVVSRRGLVNYDTLYACHADAEVLINATPVGMYPHNLHSPVNLAAFPRLKGVADVIYNPAKTALILDAEELHLPHTDGLRMMVAQAWHAARQFLGQDIPAQKMNEAYRSVRRETLNLVLTGMPGCGKSTLGREMAQRLGRTFVDLDVEIEKIAGPIPAIFAAQGEAGFRDIESRVVETFGKESGLVIATGGGAILRKSNVRTLRQNGVVAWVQRPIEQLSQEGRPLSTGIDALRRMADTRTPLYQAAADFFVRNTGTVTAAVQQLWEGFNEAAGS